MPLGLLTKDSFLNLAEMAAEKEENEASGAQAKHTVSGEDEELVMAVETHEIKDLSEINDSDMNAGVPLGEFARDSLGQFTPEDDSNDLAELEKLVREHEAAAAAADKLSLSPAQRNDSNASANSEISRLSSTASDIAARKFVASMSDEFEDEPQSSSYGTYEGFSADYPEYDQYSDPASYTSYAFKRNSAMDLNVKGKQGFWCCLFPWIGTNSDEDSRVGDASEREKESYMNVGDSDTAAAKSAAKDDDEVSTGSDIFGQKLSEKERQAVLARLRLAQPDSAAGAASSLEKAGDESSRDASISASPSSEKGLLNGIVQDGAAKSKRPKGILRRPSTLSQIGLNKMATSTSQSPANGETKQKRRSLFPAYEAPKTEKKNLKVEFASMARVMTVKSHKEMEEEEKSDIWWQRSDYEEFRKTGRMIVRAMLEGGSEIWLATSQSWQMPNQGRATTLKNAISLAEQKKAFEKGDINAKKEYEAARDKWWHKFGHSRRGLEHIASIDEGRQRQANVRIAIKAVVDEQRRQKAFNREDPEKLRMVSIQHTSWARDLALASGASDADVLRQNFDETNRKSREFYLLKFSRSNQSSLSSTAGKIVPAFMRPAMSLSVAPSRLDENTISQIRYRQTQIKKHQTSSTSSTTSTSTTPQSSSSLINDSTEESMAKKAAGYATGEGLNMSAILTGMGAMPAEAATAGGP